MFLRPGLKSREDLSMRNIILSILFRKWQNLLKLILTTHYLSLVWQLYDTISISGWHVEIVFLFSVYFNSALYGTVYFLKGPIKTEQNVLVFDWLTSEFLIILLWSAIYNCPSKQIYIYMCVCVCVCVYINN